MKRAIFVFFIIMTATCMAAPAGARDWETNFRQALKKAKENSKYLLLNFSGSDWCVYCKKLDKEVFSQKAFQKYARKNFVCVILDFPFKSAQDEDLKAQNTALAGRYRVQGYPTIVILNSRGKLVQKTGYLPGGVKNYIEHLKEIIVAYEGKSS